MRLTLITIKLLLVLTLGASLTSCNRQEQNAKKSLEGRWKVTEIQTYYGAYSSEVILEEGNLGYFNFNQDLAAYSFNHNDTLYSGNTTWDLDVDKQNAGFFRETVFTLSLHSDYTFDVFFEDGTRNSERDAEYIRLSNHTTADYDDVLIALELEKD